MITASAPGSIMITGEHAVLHGAEALVGAVNHRVQVTLEPRTDQRITVQSALGYADTTLSELAFPPPLSFVGRAIRACAAHDMNGFDLHITADMPSTVGLGTSAAVTVATLAALHAYGSMDVSPMDLHAQALGIARDLQGSASGADMAASVWGGVLRYRALPTPQIIRRHTLFPPISLIYCGYKTPTAEVIRHVEKQRQTNPETFDALFQRMHACTLAADEAWEAGDWDTLAQALQNGQTLMVALGVSDDTLDHWVKTLEDSPGILAAKISGSGLGDCVLALGRKLPADRHGNATLCVDFSEQGLTLCEQ